MGSPLGVVMQRFAFDIVKEQISSCDIQPEIHQHYLDDCFDIIENENHIPVLLKIL